MYTKLGFFLNVMCKTCNNITITLWMYNKRNHCRTVVAQQCCKVSGKTVNPEITFAMSQTQKRS